MARLFVSREEISDSLVPNCVVATFARTWDFLWFAHVLANVATDLKLLLVMTNESLETLLVGYGNEWCGDDGLGPVVARLVEGFNLPHVRVLALPQLTLDLAEPLSRVNRALFVDARLCLNTISRNALASGSPRKAWANAQWPMSSEIKPCITAQRLPITIEPLFPNSNQSSLTHSCSPETLLSLAHILYGRSPMAWIMTIAGSKFSPGDELSDLAHQHAREAASRIASWLQSPVADPDCLESTV